MTIDFAVYITNVYLTFVIVVATVALVTFVVGFVVERCVVVEVPRKSSTIISEMHK